ncbi:cytochrome P450 [Ganoderma sinense ZZ0214-1]|uniref:Cytochrome P450 n=1 Tax=Ganoderma sinense ZZ0214-1 TaxID=1077348 RepID=A0A2G8RTJ0_9APHY|nr:cytochrome P450 [Ganoderma sinense ZZ0214-1]
MFLHAFTFLISCVFAFLLVAFIRRFSRRKAAPRYPPGPRPLPVAGNLFDVPRTDLGRGFAELSQTYGDLVYLNVLGQRMLIVGSYDAAEEILDKQSATTSDRPDSVMLRLCGLQWFFPFMPYGQAWRRRRRAFHQSFDAHAIADYHPIQASHVRRLVHNLLASPEKFRQHLQFSLAAMVLQLAYKIELHNVHEEPYTMIERLVNILDDVSIPGKYLVEAFPILQHLPSWLPGTNFKSLAAAVKSETESILTRLHAMSISAVGKHSGPGMDVSIVGRILGDREITGDNTSAELELEGLCKSTAASAYLGEHVPTKTMAQVFIVMMALYPRVQQKAQEELDAVVGPNRLPNFDDIASLPYLNALVNELLRWHSPIPFGIPHRTTSDEEYKGYFIPESTVVFANTWDPKEYPEPDTFIPERFLGGEENDGKPMDPHQYAYGHGRRICPGRFFADETLQLLYASVLHSFDIKPPLDENGRPKQIEYKVSNDTVLSHPVLYDFVITPRSTNAENLIRSMGTGSAA